MRLHRRKRAPKSAIPRFTDYSISCMITLCQSNSSVKTKKRYLDGSAFARYIFLDRAIASKTVTLRLSL